MAEQTNPAAPAGVAQAPELSVEQRLGNFFKAEKAAEQHKSIPRALAPEQVPSEAPPAETEEAPQDQAPKEADAEADQPAAEDEAPSEAQSEGELWSIVHNGTEVKLNREEVIRHAQQGFDYDRKSQALAEDRKQLEQTLQVAVQMRAVAPQVLQAQAEAQALASQLKAWESVDWVQVAMNDRENYPAYRAQFDKLERDFKMAQERATKASSEFDQAANWAMERMMAHEARRLPDLEPDFRKPDVLNKVLPEVRAYALKRGIPAEYIAAANNAGLVAVAYDGYRYQKYVASSKNVVEKQVRAAAPMQKPAAAQSPQSAAERDYRSVRAQLKKSGSVDDAARLLAGLGSGQKR